HPAPPPFPTRRSSDLSDAVAQGGPRVGLAAGQRIGRKASGFKRLQSRVANGVRAAILRDGTRDIGCGLKAFRREVFLALPYFDRSGEHTSELPSLTNL